MSLQELTNSFLSSISVPFSIKITSSIYESMNNTLKANSNFLSEFFCHNQGDFISLSSKCNCDPGMFGLHCSQKGIEVWKGWYTFFKVLFGILYGILALLFWLFLLVRMRSDIKVKHQICRMIFTPKYIVHFNLVIISTARFFYVVIDPLCQKEIISHTHDMMVYFMIVAAFIAFYMQLFIVWTGITAVFEMGMNKISKKCFVCLYNKTKVIFIICMIFVYTLQILVNYALAQRTNTTIENKLCLYFGCVVFFALFVTIIFLILKMRNRIITIYGEKVHREDFDVKVKSTKKDKREDEETNKENEKKNEIIDFIVEMKKSNMINIVEYYILNKNTNDDIGKDEQLEYKLDFEKEIINLDQYHQQKDLSIEKTDKMSKRSTEIDTLKIKHMSSSDDKSVPDKKVKTVTEVNPLSANDKKVIRNIFHMSYAIIILTIFVVYLNIGASWKVFNTIGGTLALYYITFLCEVGGLIFIYKLFFTDLSVQEYQNLKILGEIEKYLNPTGELTNNPRILYKEFSNSNVYGRFKNFVPAFDD